MIGLDGLLLLDFLTKYAERDLKKIPKKGCDFQVNEGKLNSILVVTNPQDSHHNSENSQAVALIPLKERHSIYRVFCMSLNKS